jgi:hypothetical protein
MPWRPQSPSLGKEIVMNKLLSTVAAAAVTLASSAFVYAQSEQQSQDQTQREQEYVAALKKCEPLNGADKQKCIDAAKKKFGQM